MHLRKLPSGKWRVIVKKNGMQRTGSAPTKAKAQVIGAKLLLELGAAPTAGTATLGEMLHLHLSEQPYAETTRYDLGLVVAAIPDEVMGWRVSDIEPFTIEQLYRTLGRAGWTPHRLRKLHMLLSSAWTYRAGEYGWSSRTLMKSVRAPQVETPEVRPPSNDTVRSILLAVEKGAAVFLRVAAASGARRGEVCGLQWNDVDLERRELVIRRSVAYVPGQPGPIVTEGKTGRAGHRVIGVDAATMDLLAIWREQQHTKAAEMEPPTTPIWVFSHNAGQTPYRGDYMTREFARACKRIGVENTHLHSLRHAMATTWLTGGEAAMAVAQRLGHSSPATTLRVYSHFLGAADHEQAARYAL